MGLEFFLNKRQIDSLNERADHFTRLVFNRMNREAPDISRLLTIFVLGLMMNFAVYKSSLPELLNNFGVKPRGAIDSEMFILYSIICFILYFALNYLSNCLISRFLIFQKYKRIVSIFINTYIRTVFWLITIYFINFLIIYKFHISLDLIYNTILGDISINACSVILPILIGFSFYLLLGIIYFKLFKLLHNAVIRNLKINYSTFVIIKSYIATVSMTSIFIISYILIFIIKIDDPSNMIWDINLNNPHGYELWNLFLSSLFWFVFNLIIGFVLEKILTYVSPMSENILINFTNFIFKIIKLSPKGVIGIIGSSFFIMANVIEFFQSDAT